MLPVFQKELDNFKHHIDSLKSPKKGVAVKKSAFKNTDVKIIAGAEGV
jgi:hypothetical protein